MASCLVPEFPAVVVALEHLKELEEQLTEDGAPPELRRHLEQISAAVIELEAERRAAHEFLEEQTTENYDLRHQSHNPVEEVESGGAAEETEQLHEGLREAHELLQEAGARHQHLLQENQALSMERERAQAQHDHLLASLEENITHKVNLQKEVQETQRRTEELKTSLAAADHDKVLLQENQTRTRVAFNAQQENLSKEEGQLQENIKQQEDVVRKRRRELEEVHKRKEEAERSLEEISARETQLENNVGKLQESLSSHDKRLEEEIQTHQQLQSQRDELEEEAEELEEAFSLTVRNLQEQMFTVEKETEGEQASGRILQQQQELLRHVYRERHKEEEEVRLEVGVASQQLERSKHQLEERIASFLKYQQEITEVEKQIRDLQETHATTQRSLQRSQEELRGEVQAERSIVSQLEEEKEQLHQQLEQARRNQQEHREEMTSNISSMRRTYEELQREEVALLQREPRSAEEEVLRSHIRQRKMEGRQTENIHQRELQRHQEEEEILARSNQEKQRELEKQQAILREQEEECEQEVKKNESLVKLSQELKKEKEQLETSILDLQQETRRLLESKENLKQELQEVQEHHIHTLCQRTSALRKEEVKLYNHRVKLEQVQEENSRLHLAIQHLTEEAHGARRDGTQYLQETLLLSRDSEAVKAALQEAWRQDSEETQEHQSRMEEVLQATAALEEQLKERRNVVGTLDALLLRAIADVRRRLGEQTVNAGR